MSNPTSRRPDRALWLQSACTTVVALGAAYASYRHGQAFASRFGADPTTAAIWPLIVDGLLMIATVELWKTPSRPSVVKSEIHGLPGHRSTSTATGESRWAAWLSFLFGIALSLCANIASAPQLNALTIAVAACPPLALLLSVELLNRALKRRRSETTSGPGETPSEPQRRFGEIADETDETNTENLRDGHPTVIGTPTAPSPLSAVGNPAHPNPSPGSTTTAERRMWAYYWQQRANGQTPTGAELDRIVGTHNYGRRVLRRWHQRGLLPPKNGIPATKGEVAPF